MTGEEETTPQDELQPWDDAYEEAAEGTTAETALPDSAESLQAMLAAEREKAAAEARTAAESEFEKRRSDLDRRNNKNLEAIRAAGLDITEGGRIASVDPVKAAQLLVGQQPQRQVEEDSEDLGNPWEDGYAQRLEAKLSRSFQQKLEERDRQWEQRLNQTEQFASPQFNAQVQKQVEAALSLAGVTGIEADDAYQSMLGNTLRGIVQSGGQLTKEAVQGAALMVLPMMDADRIKEVKTANEQKAATAGRTEAATARQQMGPSSGTRQVQAPVQRSSDPGLDEAGAIIDELFENDSRYTKFHRDLNRAVAYDSRPDAPLGGKSATQRLIDKRLKEGRGV